MVMGVEEELLKDSSAKHGLRDYTFTATSRDLQLPSLWLPKQTLELSKSGTP